jgi:hypothetical protein
MPVVLVLEQISDNLKLYRGQGPVAEKQKTRHRLIDSIHGECFTPLMFYISHTFSGNGLLLLYQYSCGL